MVSNYLKEIISSTPENLKVRVYQFHEVKTIPGHEQRECSSEFSPMLVGVARRWVIDLS